MNIEPLLVLVEDDRAMRAFLKTLLESHGYRLVTAASCREALAMITSHAPDLVLLDLTLPDDDGLTVLRTVREWSRVPTIVLSARDREMDKVVALDSGADDYLTKPFGALELLARGHFRLAAEDPKARNRELF